MKKVVWIFILVAFSIFGYSNNTAIKRDPFATPQSTTISAQPLNIALIPIHYTNADDLAALLKNSALLSDQGRAGVLKHSNILWVRDNSNHLLRIRGLIKQLDVAAKQVSITARIVSVDASFSQELGLKFSTQKTVYPVSKDNLSMDMPAPSNQTGKFNLAIARLGHDTVLNLELAALESEGHGKIISSPQLITEDQKPAYIEAGEEIPYQEKTSSGATSVSFKKAVLSLKVTPTIMPNNKILLQLIVNQNKISPVIVNGVPAIQTREIQTQVLVNNRDTIVLGGIYEYQKRNQVERIPFFGAIPVLGKLFRSREIKKERRELLIFVTPKISSVEKPYGQR